MGIVETDLNRIQARLHDDGTLWSREELLRYYNDGYRQMLTQSQCTKRLHVFDTPGRHAYTGTFEWEDRHASGTFYKFSRTSERESWFTTFQWEIEHLRGVTPTNSNTCVTQLWERSFITDQIDQHFRFLLGTQHHALVRVTHNRKRLAGVSVRALDLKDTAWFRQGGSPTFYTPGAGRDLTFEVFEVVTTYNSPYDFNEAYTRGGVRSFSGSRTYTTEFLNALPNGYAYSTRGDAHGLAVNAVAHAGLTGYGKRFTHAADDISNGFGTQLWEKELLDGKTVFTDGVTVGTYPWEGLDGFAVAHEQPLGVMRNAHSPDRQYAPQAYNTGELQNLGLIREVKSSDDTVTVLESITPGRPLVEADNPALIPLQMHKYLRYYTLHRAFAVPGEGMRPDLAKHYLERFDRGILVLKFLATPTARARVYRRDAVETVESGGRPPRVRLPSTFPRVL